MALGALGKGIDALIQSRNEKYADTPGIGRPINSAPSVSIPPLPSNVGLAGLNISSRPKPSLSETHRVAQTLKDMGQGGDSDVVHVNDSEKAVLKRMGGSGTINPRTGLKQYLMAGDAEGEGDTASTPGMGGHDVGFSAPAPDPGADFSGFHAGDEHGTVPQGFADYGQTDQQFQDQIRQALADFQKPPDMPPAVNIGRHVSQDPTPVSEDEDDDPDTRTAEQIAKDNITFFTRQATLGDLNMVPDMPLGRHVSQDPTPVSEDEDDDPNPVATFLSAIPETVIGWISPFDIEVTGYDVIGGKTSQPAGSVQGQVPGFVGPLVSGVDTMYSRVDPHGRNFSQMVADNILGLEPSWTMTSTDTPIAYSEDKDVADDDKGFMADLSSAFNNFGVNAYDTFADMVAFANPTTMGTRAAAAVSNVQDAFSTAANAIGTTADDAADAMPSFNTGLIGSAGDDTFGYEGDNSIEAALNSMAVSANMSDDGGSETYAYDPDYWLEYLGGRKKKGRGLGLYDYTHDEGTA